MSNRERVHLQGSFPNGRLAGLAAAVFTATLLGSACGSSARTAGDDDELAAVGDSSQAAGRAGDAARASAGSGQNPSGSGSVGSVAAVSGGTGATVAAVAAGNGGSRAAAASAGGAADVAAGAALESRSECLCNGSGAKVPINPFTARPHEVPNQIVLKFVDGARTLALEVGIGFRARERSSQDLAELDCVQLKADAADSALLAINQVLAASPSISIEPVFPGAASSHDGERDFNGRHCVAAGQEALADLTNYYTLHILESDGPRLMRAFDESPIVQTAYFAPEPAPPP